MTSNLKYGWSRGHQLMEERSLTDAEAALLTEITDVAFREMGERTRAGSGDDQAYVDAEYDRLRKDHAAKLLARIVFRLCLQTRCTEGPLCKGELVAVRLIFERFDKYAVIKDDQWYKDLKAEVLRE